MGSFYNRANTIALAALLSPLAAFSTFFGCDTKSSNSGDMNTGGVPAAGGSSQGGNAGLASGGSSVAGGGALADSGVGPSCTPDTTVLAPTDGLIADFAEADSGVDGVGNVYFVYPDGASAPAVSIQGGTLHLTVNAPATQQKQYLGVGIGPEIDCINASAFTGVQFTISGSFSGCVLRFFSADEVHQDLSAGHYPSKTEIAVTQIASDPKLLKMPFSGQTGGNPDEPIDPSKLFFVAWEFTVDAMVGNTPSNCVANIAIDNVKFY